MSDGNGRNDGVANYEHIKPKGNPLITLYIDDRYFVIVFMQVFCVLLLHFRALLFVAAHLLIDHIHVESSATGNSQSCATVYCGFISVDHVILMFCRFVEQVALAVA